MDHTGANVYKGMVGLYPIYDPSGPGPGRRDARASACPASGRTTRTAPSTSSTTSRWPSTTAAWTTASPRTGHPHVRLRRDAPGVVGQDVLPALPEPRLRGRHLHGERHGLPGPRGEAAQVPLPLPGRLDLAHLRASLMSSTQGPKSSASLGYVGGRAAGPVPHPRRPAVHAVTQIASDGGLLPFPIVRDSFELWPAKRREVIVDFTRYHGRHADHEGATSST